MSIMRNLLPEIWKNKAQIAEGIKNRIFKKQHIEELATHRQEICKDCIWYSEKYRNDEEIPEVITKIRGEDVRSTVTGRPDAHCINCGCNVATKTRCLSCNCPILRWQAVVSDDQRYEIEKITNNEG